MAEWLRPGLWEVLTIKLRVIEPGPNPDSKEVHIGRCNGFNHVRNSIWRRHLPIIYGGQNGQVVKAGSLGGTHN
jgi:hypothetical protein